jgi:hypothetical protein
MQNRTILQFKIDIEQMRLKTYVEFKYFSDIELIEYLKNFESEVSKQYNFKFVETAVSDSDDTK